MQILPNEVLGTVGQQSSAGLPIDSMCVTHDNQFLVTTSHDCLKFWPMEALPTLPSHSTGKRKTKADVFDTDDTYARKKKKKQKKKDTSDANFFCDL